MDFDYFYKEESNQYAFYRIPKILIVDECFLELSTNAKLLYGLLLDRVSLSASSGWLDDEGRVYIIYTIKSIQRDLHCGDKKAVRLLQELADWGLVEKVVQGQGKPTLIYVKNFYKGMSKQRFKDGHNNDSRMVKTTILGSSKGQCNNTNITNTEFMNTYPILSVKNVDNKNTDRNIEDKDVDHDEDERISYHQYFEDYLEMKILRQRYPYDTEILDALMEMILDVVCSKRKTIRIAGDDKPVNVVKAQFMKLDMGHIEYVLEGLQNSSSKVRNIKQYMLATLYNAPLTMKNYYQSWVNHDMATGKLYGGEDERN